VPAQLMAATASEARGATRRLGILGLDIALPCLFHHRTACSFSSPVAFVLHC
jgi:hypothetical protein